MNISVSTFNNTHNVNFIKNFPIPTRTHNLFPKMKNGYLSISQLNPRKSSLSAHCISHLKKSEASTRSEEGEDEDEWKEMEKWAGKCIGEEGMVEMMECLEKEAIMGDDNGKTASDYNRRALIFEKSDRVFQNLKQNNALL